MCRICKRKIHSKYPIKYPKIISDIPVIFGSACHHIHKSPFSCKQRSLSPVLYVLVIKRVLNVGWYIHRCWSSSFVIEINRCTLRTCAWSSVITRFVKNNLKRTVCFHRVLVTRLLVKLSSISWLGFPGQCTLHVFYYYCYRAFLLTWLCTV